MQKKLLVALCAAALTAGLSMNSFAADEDAKTSQAVINFHGKIIDTPCEIGLEDGKNTVELGTYPTEFFQKNGAETDKVNFNLVIGKCSIERHVPDNDYDYNEETGVLFIPATRVKLTFIDNSAENTGAARNGLMNLTSVDANTAQNIGIRVQYFQQGDKSKGAAKDLFETQAMTRAMSLSEIYYERETDGGFKQFVPMTANMARVSDQVSVTSGEVNGQMTVLLSYE